MTDGQEKTCCFLEILIISRRWQTRRLPRQIQENPVSDQRIGLTRHTRASQLELGKT